jgi:acetate kinase
VKVLVLNVGSTSIKYNLYDMDTEARLAAGRVERVGTDGASHVEGSAPGVPVDGHTAAAALRAVLSHLTRAGGPLADARELGAIGHRVVHGGEQLVAPVRIDDKVEVIIEQCAVYAPLHNPVNLAGIRAAREVFPDVPHVAVFDTAFHGQLPPAAFTYALPHELYLSAASAAMASTGRATSTWRCRPPSTCRPTCTACASSRATSAAAPAWRASTAASRSTPRWA